MPVIDLTLDGDGAWPDLEAKRRSGRLITLAEDAVLGITCLAHGMQSGRASIAFRFELPDGCSVFGQSSLRAVWSAVQSIAERHGENHMKRPPPSDRERVLQLAVQDLSRQLLAAQARLGEEPTIDLSAADRQWDEEQARRGGKTT